MRDRKISQRIGDDIGNEDQGDQFLTQQGHDLSDGTTQCLTDADFFGAFFSRIGNHPKQPKAGNKNRQECKIGNNIA